MIQVSDSTVIKVRKWYLAGATELLVLTCKAPDYTAAELAEDLRAAFPSGLMIEPCLHAVYIARVLH